MNNKPDSKVEVKCCPFCGHKPKLLDNLNVHCNNKMCVLYCRVFWHEHWSTRSPIANNGVSLEDFVDNTGALKAKRIINRDQDPERTFYDLEIYQNPPIIKEKNMLNCISTNFPVTKDAILVEKHFGSSLTDTAKDTVFVKVHAKEILEEARLREAENKSKE